MRSGILPFSMPFMRILRYYITVAVTTYENIENK